MINAFALEKGIKDFLLANISSKTVKEMMQPVQAVAIDKWALELFGAEPTVTRMFAAMVNAYLRIYHGVHQINTIKDQSGSYVVRWGKS